MGLVEFSVWKKTFVVFKMPILGILGALGVGQLPAEYNPKIHGPYDPAVYYGPKDTTFLNTKLGQLPGWLMRRPKNPIDWFRATNRSWWRWRNAYLLPRYANGSGVFQFMAAWAVFMYVVNYDKLTPHTMRKHHW